MVCLTPCGLHTPQALLSALVKAGRDQQLTSLHLSHIHKDVITDAP